MTGDQTIRKVTPEGDVVTIAGAAGQAGSADGTGSAARFDGISGIATDAAGNLFVADSFNCTIRRITPGGVVTTFAGRAGERQSRDGTGDTARFGTPTCLTSDALGNLYVADAFSYQLRKISPGAVVTTVASTFVAIPSGLTVDGAGNIFGASSLTNSIMKLTAAGSLVSWAGEQRPGGAAQDGTGSAARFGRPCGLATDTAGNVYVADAGSHAIRRISPDALVTTIGGLLGVPGTEDGVGTAARFNTPYGVAVDAAGNLYIADSLNHTIRKGTPAAFAFTVQPENVHASAGSPAALRVVVTGTAPTFQWKKDGVPISGATTAVLSLANTSAADMGFYTVVVGSGVDAMESNPGILTVATPGITGRLINVSTRALALAGEGLTPGFVLAGNGTKQLLIRGIGPTLARFGVTTPLADPQIEMFAPGSMTAHLSNNDWGANPNVPALVSSCAAVGAFPLNDGSKDAAALATLTCRQTSAYTVRVTGTGSGTGAVALAEVYDADPISSPVRLVNVSTRGFVGLDGDTMAIGFVIGGGGPMHLLIRAIGPGLTGFGVPGVLTDPQVSVVPLGRSVAVAENDNWVRDPALLATFAAAGAFPLPVNSRDAAMVIRLPPGGYTVNVSGVGRTTGVVLAEVYELP